MTGAISPGHSPKGPVYGFKLTLTEAENLINAADGMQPNKNPDWKGFPQRATNEWGVGFTDQYTVTAMDDEIAKSITKSKEGTKGEKDGALSAEEAQLAKQQLTWDREEEARNNTDPNVNPNPIQINPRSTGGGLTSILRSIWNFILKLLFNREPVQDPGSSLHMTALNEQGEVADQPRNAMNFLGALYSKDGQMTQSTLFGTGPGKAAFDADGDGKYTIQDFKLLSSDGQTITSDDLNRAFEKAQNETHPGATR